jgi:hypothetical protein
MPGFVPGTHWVAGARGALDCRDKPGTDRHLFYSTPAPNLSAVMPALVSGIQGLRAQARVAQDRWNKCGDDDPEVVGCAQRHLGGMGAKP